MCGEEMKFIQQAFDTNWIAPLGANVDAFETELAPIAGRKFGAALSAGTHAIHLSLKLLNVGAGDFVFCSSLTFSGSCNAIVYEKAIPVFIDSDESWNMSPYALKKAFKHFAERKTLPKAVIIVDLYGQSADYDALLAICAEYNVPVIEDAAEALGANYKGKPCGSFGELAILSFNGNKIITTSGGGMLLSNNEEQIQKAKFWATQARDSAPYYQHSEIGYNYRLSNISAGIGRGQLLCLKERVAQKKAIFNNYCKGFSDINAIKMMYSPQHCDSTYWLSVMTVCEKSSVKPSDIIDKLGKMNIEARHIWKPMHLQPVFKDAMFFSSFDGKTKESFAESFFNNGVCLPSATTMTSSEQQLIIDAVKDMFYV